MPMLLSNGDYVLPSTIGETPNLPQISPEYKTAQACSDNKNVTLISLGKICNDDCLALPDKHKMVVFKNHEPVLRAARCNQTGICLVNLSNPIKLINATVFQKAAKIVQIDTFILMSRLLFLHGALGRPTSSTLCKAIQAGHLTTWPDLTTASIAKLKTLDYATLGHLDQKRKNVQSTREGFEESD